jgi:hypothetical protein
VQEIANIHLQADNPSGFKSQGTIEDAAALSISYKRIETKIHNIKSH